MAAALQGTAETARWGRVLTPERWCRMRMSGLPGEGGSSFDGEDSVDPGTEAQWRDECLGKVRLGGENWAN